MESKIYYSEYHDKVEVNIQMSKKEFQSLTGKEFAYSKDAYTFLTKNKILNRITKSVKEILKNAKGSTL